jgi:cysteine-rich repeat protein
VRIPGQAWTTIAAGTHHTCGKRQDGSLWCWGQNTEGEVGDGTGNNRDTPEQVVGNLCSQVPICGNSQVEQGEECDDGNNTSDDGCRRKGVQPKLALAYSSEGGEGIMGLGWHVDGLSTISRCPQDYARDGKPQAIQFDNDDRLCLDGERLVLAPGSPGEYNKAGSEYRTENDKHMKIVQVGADPNPALGPTGFLVYLPDGTRRSYGYDTSASLSGFDGSASAVLQANRATVTASASDSNDPTVAYDTPVRLAWALASWRDRYDNEVGYSYIQGENSTEQDQHFIVDFRPQQIAYTGGPAGAATRFVTFAYDEDSLQRKDIRESFVGGLPLRIGHLLTSITMEGPSPDTRGVLRAYKPDGAQFDRIDTKIEDMKDFGRVIIAAPGWTELCQPGTGVVVVGDMNGDGHDDIMLSLLTDQPVGYWLLHCSRSV